MNFIDEHRYVNGVEPIRAVLQIAPSGYRRHAARRRDPEKRCARAKRDAVLVPEIERASGVPSFRSMGLTWSGINLGARALRLRVVPSSD